MPLYLDVHHLPGARKEDLAKAHVADMEAQERHGVTYHKYWFDGHCGKAYCLVEAPDAEAANAVHREAHGLVADRIIQIDPDLAEGFLGGGSVNAYGAATLFEEYDSGTRTILFSDIVGSTEMAQRLGDTKAVQLVALHDSIVEEAVADNHGRVVKHIGDGSMCSFVSSAAAVQSACQIQRKVAEMSASEPENSFQLRIGAASGVPIERGNDLFGSTVNLAARLCSKADPGSVLVTEEIAQACREAGLTFRDTRNVQLRGFDEDVMTREVVINC